jgi:Uma2 family endonuclease
MIETSVRESTEALFRFVMSAAQQRLISLSEYETLDRDAEFKSEYYRGEMFAISGGSPEHSLIASNFIGEVREKLKGNPCVPYSSDLRIKVEATGLYTYPDASIVCGPLQFDTETKNTVVNPTVLVEVLSDSTEVYDRGKKATHYRQIESLQYLVLVSQTEPHIESYHRLSDGTWSFVEYRSLGESLCLDSIGVAVPLSEIYRSVQFPPAAPLPPPPSNG